MRDDSNLRSERHTHSAPAARTQSRRERAVVAAAVAAAACLVAVTLPASLRVPRQGPLASTPDSACRSRPYMWARAAGLLPTAVNAAPLEVNFAGDSVRLMNYSFRPGKEFEIVSTGLIHNGTRSQLEIRGYRLEFLSNSGQVVAERTCRIRMGANQCGVGGTNLKRPGEVTLIADTLDGAPPTVDRDTARIFWLYCLLDS